MGFAANNHTHFFVFWTVRIWTIFFQAALWLCWHPALLCWGTEQAVAAPSLQVFMARLDETLLKVSVPRAGGCNKMSFEVHSNPLRFHNSVTGEAVQARLWAEHSTGWAQRASGTPRADFGHDLTHKGAGGSQEALSLFSAVSVFSCGILPWPLTFSAFGACKQLLPFHQIFACIHVMN